MWTSERNSRRTVEEPAVELGQVTLLDGTAGVNLGGERRWLPLCCPGGYAWRPAAGDRVVVLRAGAERESPCVLGTLREETDLEPGEVRLSGKDCALSLTDGGLDLRGTVLVNGTGLEALVRDIAVQVVLEMLG